MRNEFTPQAYTHIYWLIEDGKIGSDQLFDFLELYWPTFIEKDGYIFLKEQYSEERYDLGKKNPEFWINFLNVDDFFINSINKEKQSIEFSRILAEIWKIKLEKDFPLIEFIVKCLEDQENGDYGLTFYQTKHGS